MNKYSLDIYIKKSIEKLKKIEKNIKISNFQNKYNCDFIYVIIFSLLIISFLSSKYRKKNNIKNFNFLYNIYLLLTFIIISLLIIFIYYYG